MAIYVVDLTIFFHLWEIYAYYTMKCGKSDISKQLVHDAKQSNSALAFESLASAE
ncbi:MAG: hypothetical protein V7K32_09350 [Nostoc sp.]